MLDRMTSVGFAIGEIEEALGLLEDTEKSDAKYWAYKSLVRARDRLRDMVEPIQETRR